MKQPYRVVFNQADQFLLLLLQLAADVELNQGQKRPARVSKWVRPAIWSSRLTNSGLSDKGAPFKR